MAKPITVEEKQGMKFDEFFGKLWFGYPKNLCHDKKGTKFNAQKACKKLPESEYEKILMNMEALIKYDMKDPKPDRWPHVSSWINQGYYDREIGSTTEQRERVAGKNCSHDGCNAEVHGSAFSVCSSHIPCQHDNRLREAWTRTGIDRKSGNLAQQCRDYIQERKHLLNKSF